MRIISDRMKKIQITGIHKDDAFYYKKEEFIGLKGHFRPNRMQHRLSYFAGTFYNDKFVSGEVVFLAIRYKKIAED